MVLHHVAQRAGGVVVAAAAAFHAEVFGAGDLHVVDVAAVPVGLKDGVGKAQHHDVLRGFLAQIVVDAVGVLFGKGGGHHRVQALRGGEVFAKRFLTHHTGPLAALALVQARSADHLQDGLEGLRRGGEVEEAVGRRTALRIKLVQQAAEGLVALQVFKLTAVVVDGLGEAFPQLVVVALAAVLLVAGLQLGAEDLVCLVAAGKAHHLELRRQVALGGDVVKGGDQLAVGEVASSAKDDHGAGFCTMT